MERFISIETRDHGGTLPSGCDALSFALLSPYGGYDADRPLRPGSFLLVTAAYSCCGAKPVFVRSRLQVIQPNRISVYHLDRIKGTEEEWLSTRMNSSVSAVF